MFLSLFHFPFYFHLLFGVEMLLWHWYVLKIFCERPQFRMHSASCLLSAMSIFTGRKSCGSEENPLLVLCDGVLFSFRNIPLCC